MGTNTDVSEYVTHKDTDIPEVTMGIWVTLRCLARRLPPNSREVPDYVEEWLEKGGNSKPGKDTQAPPKVLYWLIKTIDDPAWAE
ncbi:MAG: hypothetical protein ACYTFA_05460 [Planctomycetota bacterium]|jgi:hypothetical protein